MGDILRRGAVPALAWFTAAALQVSGLENGVAATALALAGLIWAIIAASTWEPITRRLAYLWRGHEADPPQPPVDPRSELRSRLREFCSHGQQLYDSETTEVYSWSQAVMDLLQDAFGRDFAEKFFNDGWTPTETDHEHVNRILAGLYRLLADIDSLEMRDDWNP